MPFFRHQNGTHLGLFHSGEKRWQDLMEPGLVCFLQRFPGNLWQSEAPHRSTIEKFGSHLHVWPFCRFCPQLSKKLSPCLDQLSWLDVEKRSRTSTENAVQNHGKIDVFVAITWWWKFPHWFKKSETRYHAVS